MQQKGAAGQGPKTRLAPGRTNKPRRDLRRRRDHDGATGGANRSPRTTLVRTTAPPANQKTPVLRLVASRGQCGSIARCENQPQPQRLCKEHFENHEVQGPVRRRPQQTSSSLLAATTGVMISPACPHFHTRDSVGQLHRFVAADPKQQIGQITPGRGGCRYGYVQSGDKPTVTNLETKREFGR